MSAAAAPSVLTHHSSDIIVYSTLTALKAFVLPSPLQDRSDYDAALQQIGEGVAEAFDRFCDRKLRRAVDDSFIVSGRSTVCVLPRYPVESITRTETREDYSAAWVEETGLVDLLFARSGVLDITPSGGEHSQLKVIFTGGYFVDLTGDTDLPSGATAMPSDLMLAWQLQCKHVFDIMDKDGESFRDADRGLGGALVSLLNIDLLPAVENRLRTYKRQAII